MSADHAEPTFVIESYEDAVSTLRSAIHHLSYTPVRLQVKKSVARTVIASLTKLMILYKVITTTPDTVVIRLMHPSHFFRVSRLLEEKSEWLVENPKMLRDLIRASTPIYASRLESPQDLIRVIRKHASSGYRMVYLHGETGSGVMVFSKGKLVAVAYLGVNTLVGEEALRIIFLMGPYRCVVYDVDADKLE